MDIARDARIVVAKVPYVQSFMQLHNQGVLAGVIFSFKTHKQRNLNQIQRNIPALDDL